MLKFDDPLLIDRLYAMSGNLADAVERAIQGEQYGEVARLQGVQQGLILAIDMACERGVRVPQPQDTPFLPAVIATLHEDR